MPRWELESWRSYIAAHQLNPAHEKFAHFLTISLATAIFDEVRASGGEHTLNEMLFKHIHTDEKQAYFLIQATINKAHGSVTDINRKCMHKIYSRWQNR